MLLSLNRLASLFNEETRRLTIRALRHAGDPFLTEEHALDYFTVTPEDWVGYEDSTRHMWHGLEVGINTWLKWHRQLRHKAELSDSPEHIFPSEITYTASVEQVHEDWAAVTGYLLEHVDDLLTVDLTPCAARVDPNQRNNLEDLSEYLDTLDTLEKHLSLTRVMHTSVIREADAEGTPAKRIARWANVDPDTVRRILKDQ